MLEPKTTKKESENAESCAGAKANVKGDICSNKSESLQTNGSICSSELSTDQTGPCVNGQIDDKQHIQILCDTMKKVSN